MKRRILFVVAALVSLLSFQIANTSANGPKLSPGCKEINSLKKPQVIVAPKGGGGVAATTLKEHVTNLQFFQGEVITLTWKIVRPGLVVAKTKGAFKAKAMGDPDAGPVENPGDGPLGGEKSLDVIVDAGKRNVQIEISMAAAVAAKLLEINYTLSCKAADQKTSTATEDGTVIATVTATAETTLTPTYYLTEESTVPPPTHTPTPTWILPTPTEAVTEEPTIEPTEFPTIRATELATFEAE